MKKTFLLFSCFCLPFFTMAQDCGKYIERNTDQVTGRTSVLMVNPIEAVNPVGQSFRLNASVTPDKVVVLLLTLENLSGCIDQGNEIHVLFTDNSRITLRNAQAFNCDGKSSVYFGRLWRNLKQLQALQTKPVQVIRVMGRKDSVEITFTPEQQENLMQSLSCLSK